MFENHDYEILQGDSLEVLKTLEDASVNCCITSPPYYGLRDYGTGKWVGGDPDCPHYRTTKKSENTATGHKAMAEVGEAVGDAIYKSICPLCGAIREDKQIGLEETPEEYIQRLVDVFREVKRVLKDDGTLWVNIGDTYNSSVSGNHDNWSEKQFSNSGSLAQTHSKHLVSSCKPKDLIGIPWMLAFALRADGWYLRQDIIWHKLNPMPEPVKDRCTKSHEYVFLFSKSSTYYFDYKAIQEPIKTSLKDTYTQGIRFGGNKYGDSTDPHYATKSGNIWIPQVSGDKETVRNKRDVWSVPTKPYNDAHFATFPKKLIEPCILAGCPKDGVVLDVFNGSGTTGVVSMENDRKYIGIELNPKYINLTIDRFETMDGISKVTMNDGTVAKVKKEDLW